MDSLDGDIFATEFGFCDCVGNIGEMHRLFLASRTTKILSRILRGFTVGHFARPQKPFSVAKSLEIEAMARIWSGCS